MDNPTGSRRHPAPAASRPAARWVSADALLRHLEARAERNDPRPSGPPPDPWQIRRRPVQRAQRDKTPIPLPPRCRHGTWWAYDRYDCRCEGCTDAAAVTRRQARHRRRERRQQEQQERQRRGSAA